MHGADGLATSAKARRVWKVGALVNADELGREHGAHRPRIDPAISVPADRGVDGAMVHASAAADAAQHVLELGAEHIRAAVIDQHDVIGVRAIGIAFAARPGGEGGVGRNFLTRRRAGKQPDDRRRVFKRRYDLLDTGDYDMRARQKLREIAVSLIGDDHRTAGLRDQEIRARDTHVRRDEFLPEHGPRFAHERRDLGEIAIRRQALVETAEIFLDLVAVQMNGRGDDMARRLMPDLNDILAKIGFDRLNACRLHRGVKPDLLRHHGFALGDGLRTGVAANLDDDLAGFGRIAGPVQMAASLLHAALILFQIDVEMSQYVVLDLHRHIAQSVELRQRIACQSALDDEAGLDVAERALKLRIVQRAVGICFEIE